MKSAYLIVGIQLRMLFRMMRRNRFSMRPRYVGRFLFLLQNALWASFFAFKDKFHHGKKIAAHSVPDDPLIIVGHWRTGSTYLHQLLNLDPSLSAPTLFQTSQPHGFITAYPYFRPIMKYMLGKHRPFDKMKAGMDEPQEDEFALLRICGFSPLEALVFPPDGQYFPAHYPSFIPEGKQYQAWEKGMKEFYRKLSWKSGRRLVLKNPFHSMRIPLLQQMFPRAQFVHIYRNPAAVVQSSMKMWSVVGTQNCMNRRWKNPECADITRFYARMIHEIDGAFAGIPDHRKYALSYEALEADPEKALREMYAGLGMNFSEDYSRIIREFVAGNTEFEKGRYNMDAADRETVRNIMSDYIKKYGYERDFQS